jgi:Stress responsive A/B Barrel Domain
MLDMLKHCVFMNLRADHDPIDLARAMGLLDGLVGKIAGMLDFAAGPNRDYEAKSADYSYGFVISFTNRAAHLAYEVHADHQAAGALIVSLCTGGHRGIFVADLDGA